MTVLPLTDAARRELGAIPGSRRVQVAGSALHIAVSRGGREIRSGDIRAAKRQP